MIEQFLQKSEADSTFSPEKRNRQNSLIRKETQEITASIAKTGDKRIRSVCKCAYRTCQHRKGRLTYKIHHVKRTNICKTPFYGFANHSRNEVFTLQVMELKSGCPPTVKQTVCLGAVDIETICIFSSSSLRTLELAWACDV